jgi:membrane associated rhomboid family serine protease
MRLEYNSPVVLTFALISTIVLVIQSFTPIGVMEYFTVYAHWQLTDPLWYWRLFSHVIGHGNWGHLLGNFTFILLLGPILEEKYGSKDLLFMMIVTAFVTGILHIVIGSVTGEAGTIEGLLGASGIVFMMILLSSITNSRNGGIPLTFILVVILFLGKEVWESFGNDQISQLAHIAGGIMGGLFGFYVRKGRDGQAKAAGVKK